LDDFLAEGSILDEFDVDGKTPTNLGSSKGQSSGDKRGATVEGLKFIYQSFDGVGIKWSARSSHKYYNITIQPEHLGIRKELINKKKNSIKFYNLIPANNYWITVIAIRSDNLDTKPVTIRVFTAPKAPENLKMTDFNEKQTIITWDNPNKHRTSCLAVARLSRSPRQIRVQAINQKANKLIVNNMPPGTSYDCVFFYVFNKRRSDSIIYRITRQPKPVQAVQIDKVRIQDKGKASLAISWKWPPRAWWGSVKIQISPPVEGLKEFYWISDRKIPVRLTGSSNRRLPDNSTVISQVTQGVIYTITVSLTRGPLESTALAVTQDVPKLTENNDLESEDKLSCKVPLNLEPQDLKLTKSLVGDPSLTVEWTHPKKKATRKWLLYNHSWFQR